jgi:hypothetical protein
MPLASADLQHWQDKIRGYFCVGNSENSLRSDRKISLRDHEILHQKIENIVSKVNKTVFSCYKIEPTCSEKEPARKLARGLLLAQSAGFQITV